MTAVKLLVSALVGERNYLPGDVVVVPDDRARHMIANEVGEATGEHPAENGNASTGGNADFNPLGDTLTPIPHGAIPINPADALAPHVGDNPGLNKLVEVAGVKDQESPAGRTSTIQPVPTEQVANQEQVDTSHRLADPTKAKGKGSKPGDLTTESVVTTEAEAAVVGAPTRPVTASVAAPTATASTLKGQAK